MNAELSSYWAFPYPSQRMPVLAENVVAASQPLAAQAGLSMLHKGGNAVDAALAAAMALDGGKESNLAVESAAVRYRSYEAESNLGRGFMRRSATLPAVIAVTGGPGPASGR